MANKTYLSKEKHKELLNELDFLKTTRRKEIAEQLEAAKEFGDLSENAEYHQAREAQATVEARIYELESMLKSVEIVSHHKSDVVEVGTTVSLKNTKTKEEREFEMVGSEEADMDAGRLSNNSPLGKAALGKAKGETFELKTPSGKTTEYKVLKIE